MTARKEEYLCMLWAVADSTLEWLTTVACSHLDSQCSSAIFHWQNLHKHGARFLLQEFANNLACLTWISTYKKFAHFAGFLHDTTLVPTIQGSSRCFNAKCFNARFLHKTVQGSPCIIYCKVSCKDSASSCIVKLCKILRRISYCMFQIPEVSAQVLVACVNNPSCRCPLLSRTLKDVYRCDLETYMCNILSAHVDLSYL